MKYPESFRTFADLRTFARNNDLKVVYAGEGEEAVTLQRPGQTPEVLYYEQGFGTHDTHWVQGDPPSVVVMRINNCPAGCEDFEALMHAIADGKHDIDIAAFEQHFGLAPDNWDWDDVRSLIEHGQLTADQVDRQIHADLR